MKITLGEFAAKTNIPVGTVRSWARKPIENVAYNASEINFAAIYKGVSKYYDDEQLKELLGCSFDDLQFVKADRTVREYLEVDQLKGFEGRIVSMHNYGLTTRAMYIGTTEDTFNGYTVYLFSTDKGYKAYTREQLEADNMRVEVIE